MWLAGSGMEPGPSEVRVPSPNHWTTREFPTWSTLNISYTFYNFREFCQGTQECDERLRHKSYSPNLKGAPHPQPFPLRM